MTQQTALDHQPGATEQLMLRHGIPLTRENWINLAYLGNPPKEWTQELEQELPPQLQRQNPKGEEAFMTMTEKERERMYAQMPYEQRQHIPLSEQMRILKAQSLKDHPGLTPEEYDEMVKAHGF